jgi:hypothetical protein
METIPKKILFYGDELNIKTELITNGTQIWN